MNELLISEINSDEKALLEKIVLIEEFIFNSSNTCLDSLESIIEQCDQSMAGITDPLIQVEEVINELYVGQLFIDKNRDFWPISAFILQKSLEYRLISPILKAIIAHHVIEECGFDVDLVFVPEKIMIRIVCDDNYVIIFDPVTGESLNWQELDSRMDDIDDPTQDELINVSMQSLIIKHLTALKGEFIREQHFDQALKCVDILLALSPDDPFERRDRGFLLHQLDCFKVAVDDYRYFVEQCPKDPAAQLLKIQLDNINMTNTVIH